MYQQHTGRRQDPARHDKSVRLLQDIDRMRHKRLGVARGTAGKAMGEGNICLHAIVSQEQHAVTVMSSINVGRGKGSKQQDTASGKPRIQKKIII